MIGNKINYHRRAKNLTQEELVHGICSTSYLSKVENNVLEPSEEILQLLFERLNIDARHEGKDSIHRLLERMEDWYATIREADFPNAEPLYWELQEQVEQISNPQVRLAFSIYSFRYHLLRYDEQTAEQLHATLHSHLSQLSPEWSYLFYTFNINYYYIKQNYTKALEYAEKALDMARMHPIEIQPETLYFQALAHVKQKNDTAAKYEAERALELFTRQGNLKMCVGAYIVLGICLNRMKRREEAKKFYLSALKLANNLDLKNDCAYISHNPGYIESQAGNHPEAIRHFKESIELKRKNGIRRVKNSIYHLATELFRIGHREEALGWIEKGRSEDNVTDAHDDIKLTMLACQIGEQTDRTDFLLTKALPYFQQRGMWVEECECYEVLAEQFSNQHHYKKSSYYFSEANRLRRENS
ncbi:helix-turn-helix transcriptional regulator [Halobacillus salinus]|uniref:helix-turn-helix transcriptional regulator n=1 Tax=Halobacillus salinus TaxID=192814 RepID=UPI0009A7D27F|nr:helix-turn-helix transcriptional regulator [Halobacillus salinus]